jgi:HSP20 family protein
MTNYMPNVLSAGFDRQIDRVFEEALRAIGASDGSWVPACNVWEDDNGFYVQMALPGWEPKDIVLEVTNQMLTVKGRQSVESEDSQKHHLREIAVGPFTRMFRLPTFVDADKASATHKHGLLAISFPKREEARRRQITIQGS